MWVRNKRSDDEQPGEEIRRDSSRPVSSFPLLSQRGGRVNGPGANEQVRGDATVRLGYNRDVSGRAVTDHPELMLLTIAGPARCYATTALPPAMTREMKHQIGFVIPSRTQGTINSFPSFHVPY